MKLSETDAYKRAAATAALQFVPFGATLGLGTGSTARHFVELLATKVRDGFDVLAIPTSEETRRQAHSGGIRLAGLDDVARLDLTVDGADEFDDQMRLIKGGGGALLREKIVAAASDRLLVIADAGKRVSLLGAFPLPVEIDRFGAKATERRVTEAAQELGLMGKIEPRRRHDGALFVSDGGHYILDCSFGSISAPDALALRLNAIPGVLEHGLFLGLATTIICAGAQGLQLFGETPTGVLDPSTSPGS